jgi:crotonobetaine/carnitine-CoA ligase
VWCNLWLHTGDAAYLDDAGNVFFVDRQKDAMRRRGENISSVEVELETNTHPAVLESAAYAVPSQWGEDDVMIAVTCRDGRTVRADELFEYLAGRLPHFMVPRYIEIMADLPRTPTQKVQKNVLRERGATKQTWDREAAGAVVGRERITLPRASGGV